MVQSATTTQVREKLRAVSWPGFDQHIVAAGLPDARLPDDRRRCGIGRARVDKTPETDRSSRELYTAQGDYLK